MGKSIRRRIGALAGLCAAATLTACGGTVAGTAVYAPEPPSENLPLVKIGQLKDLIPTPEEAREILGTTVLLVLALYTKPDSLPKDTLSEPDCAAAIIPNDTSAYAGSGYAGIYGRLADDLRNHRISTGVAAFGDAAAAEQFVDGLVQRWRQCADKPIRVKLAREELTWNIGTPQRSYGVDILPRSQEGKDYFCARGAAARSNVAADVLVCGPDAAEVNAQTGRLVNLMLDKVPQG